MNSKDGFRGTGVVDRLKECFRKLMGQSSTYLKFERHVVSAYQNSTSMERELMVKVKKVMRVSDLPDLPVASLECTVFSPIPNEDLGHLQHPGAKLLVAAMVSLLRNINALNSDEEKAEKKRALLDSMKTVWPMSDDFGNHLMRFCDDLDQSLASEKSAHRNKNKRDYATMSAPG
jgi:hypothetical protein